MIIDLIATLVLSNQQSLFFSNNILFAYARHMSTYSRVKHITYYR